jgi:hypothetical protein
MLPCPSTLLSTELSFLFDYIKEPGELVDSPTKVMEISDGLASTCSSVLKPLSRSVIAQGKTSGSEGSCISSWTTPSRRAWDDRSFASAGNRMRMFSGIIALCGLTLLGLPPCMARGHAFPAHSEPKVGTTLTVAPSCIRIWFDGALEPAFNRIRV